MSAPHPAVRRSDVLIVMSVFVVGASSANTPLARIVFGVVAIALFVVLIVEQYRARR